MPPSRPADPAPETPVRRRGVPLFGTALAAQKRTVLLASAGGLGFVVALATVPLVTRAAVDDVIVRNRPGALQAHVVILLALAALRAAGGGFRKYQAIKLQALVGADMRDRLYNHLQRLSFTLHARLGAGDVMARVAGDVAVFEIVSATVPYLAQSVLLGLVSAVVCWIIDPVLAAAALAVSVVTGMLTIRQARPLYPQARAFHDAVGDYSQFAEQQVNGIRVIKGHGLEGVEQKRGARVAQDAARRGETVAASRGRFLAWFAAVPTSGVVVTISLGGWRASRGHLTPGDVFAFLQYLGALAAPFAVAAQALVQLQYAASAGDRIADVLEIEPEPPQPSDPVRLPAGSGRVTFDDVWFGYRPDRPVLRGLTLAIEPGESVALVGQSGSGKTTVAHLVARFHDAWSGDVRIDGVKTDRLHPQDLRDAVGIVFEDTVLFSENIRENIRLGRPTATDEDVHQAAGLAQVDEFARELPDGYETVVGEMGLRLSGGQRQRIAIARAILRDPRVLILDDATSAVDPATEELVRRGLRAVTQGRTTLIIAHRVETIALADRVVLLDHGSAAATGTHHELLELPEYRAALVLDVVA